MQGRRQRDFNPAVPLPRLRSIFCWSVLLIAGAAFPQITYAPFPHFDSCLSAPAVQQLVSQGNDNRLPYADRKAAYKRALELCPRDPDLYHALALLTLQGHEFEEDLMWVRRGLKNLPDSPQLQLDEAVALISGGHPEESLPILTHLPSTADGQFYLGMAYRALADHRAAQQAFSKALDLGYQDPYVLYALIEQDRDLHDKEAGLKDFQTLYKRFPDSAWVHVVLGDVYMSRYEDSNAESEYTKALAIDPKLPVIHFQLGSLAFSHNDYSRAADEFRKEIDLDPAFGDAYLYLGLTLRRQGKNREAVPVLERAVALEPSSPLPYRALAVVQVNTNAVDAASDTLRMAKTRFPSEPAFAAQLAVLLKQMGRSEEAEEEAVLAESLSRKGNRPHQSSGAPVQSGGGPIAQSLPAADGADPASKSAFSAAATPPTQVRVGNEAVANRSFAIVTADLQQCLERNDADCASAALSAISDPKVLRTPDYLELKAQILALEHRKPEAMTAIDAAIEGNPSNPHYLITQGRIHVSFNEPLEAITSFLKAAELEPNSPEPFYFLGTTFFLLAERYKSPDYFSRAERNFRAALEASRDYHRAEFMLGVIDAVLSRLGEARTHLQRAIQMDPSNPYYHLHYGILLKHEGDNHGALGEMKTAEEENPSYALTHFELGTVYEKLGDYAQATRQLEAALKLNPDLSAAYYHLGAVYAHVGRAEESKAAYARFSVEKEHSDQPNPDPVASAISEEELEATKASSGPPQEH
jgi:tetratricopeptide (TPR) repeat protein